MRRSMQGCADGSPSRPGLELGHIEQLYTFGDRGRDARRRCSLFAYLAFVRESEPRVASVGLARLVPLFPVGGLA